MVQGKRVLVTGGGRWIGRGIVERLRGGGIVAVGARVLHRGRRGDRASGSGGVISIVCAERLVPIISLLVLAGTAATS